MPRQMGSSEEVRTVDLSTCDLELRIAFDDTKRDMLLTITNSKEPALIETCTPVGA